MSLKKLHPYIVAVLAVVVAALLRGGVLAPFVDGGAAFDVYTMAIVLAAWVGGFWPGALATVLSVGAGWLFAAPSSLAAPHETMLVILFLNGALISLVCEVLRRHRAGAEAARDETEKTRRQVRQSERRFQQLADSAPVLIRVADETGKCTWFNKPWLDFTGHAMDEEIGEGWTERMHPEDRTRCLQIYNSHLEAREPFEMDYRLKHKDGMYRWMMDCGVPLSDSTGVSLGTICSCVDIDDRTRAANDSAKLLKSEKAARLDAERTALLKDEFLATVSHEMRTPLTAMLGWVQMLRSGKLADDAIPQALATIERNARAQGKLIDDLLDMSRILSGRLHLDIQRINIAEAVESGVAAAEPSAAAKRVAITSIFDPHSGFVPGDTTRIQQVIWNLLSNAIKFTPAGGKVDVVVRPLDSHVEVSVSDSGEGISPEFLPHVFDRFRQQDASSMRRHEGLGLGLSIVKQLVELHGGTVRAESAGPGCGATFVMVLPTAAGSVSRRQEKVAIASESEIPVQEKLPSLLGLRVLVVDDDADARELLRSILAQNGASVRTASSAPDALKQFAARTPDVLVSDIGMPEQDGYDLIRDVRAMEREDGGRVPAVALTAFARSDDRRKAINAGFHIHLAKPIEPAALVTVVASLVGR